MIDGLIYLRLGSPRRKILQKVHVRSGERALGNWRYEVVLKIVRSSNQFIRPWLEPGRRRVESPVANPPLGNGPIHAQKKLGPDRRAAPLLSKSCGKHAHFLAELSPRPTFGRSHNFAEQRGCSMGQLRISKVSLLRPGLDYGKTAIYLVAGLSRFSQEPKDTRGRPRLLRRPGTQRQCQGTAPSSIYRFKLKGNPIALKRPGKKPGLKAGLDIRPPFLDGRKWQYHVFLCHWRMAPRSDSGITAPR